MATTEDFKNYILDQIESLGFIRFKKMFGEYGLFYHEMMVGVLADQKLYIKPTDQGKSMMNPLVMEKFYDKGSPYILIEDTDDRELIKELIQVTYHALEKLENSKIKRGKR